MMTRALTLVFAVAAGTAVGNLYWAQPLLDLLGRDLNVSSATAGLLVTLTQVGYAIGVLLLVPLGDVRDRRRLITTVMLAAAVALVLCAVAPSFGLLLVAITALGLTTVGGQLLLPLAGDLASEAERGRIVGTVASGVITGIILSRTISGLLADAAGWRWVYALAAAANLVMAMVLWRAIPSLPPNARMRYPALIASVATVVRRERTLRWTLALSALSFGLFTMFWTGLTFLLSAAPFDYSATSIGLVGLAGLAGAVAAQRAGQLHDRGWSLRATGTSWGAVLISFVLAGFAGRSIALLLVATVAFSVAIQVIFILNQTRLFALSADERSRINTAFVTNNFIGGALGSTAAAAFWSTGGWSAVMSAAAVASLFALAIWEIGRRGPLVVKPIAMTRALRRQHHDVGRRPPTPGQRRRPPTIRDRFVSTARPEPSGRRR
jgi:predicted MFS family arabinose efflux permease